MSSVIEIYNRTVVFHGVHKPNKVKHCDLPKRELRSKKPLLNVQNIYRNTGMTSPRQGVTVASPTVTDRGLTQTDQVGSFTTSYFEAVWI